MGSIQDKGPLFIGTGVSAPRGDKFEERQAVVAIVRDPKTRKYLTLTWKEDGRKTFVTGGIETRQTALVAALTEIEEETGYSHLILVYRLAGYEAKFYHPQKGLNRHAFFHCFFFELASNERHAIEQEESNLHEPVWLTLDELKAQVTEEGPLFLIDYIVSKGL